MNPKSYACLFENCHLCDVFPCIVVGIIYIVLMFQLEDSGVLYSAYRRDACLTFRPNEKWPSGFQRFMYILAPAI